MSNKKRLVSSSSIDLLKDSIASIEAHVKTRDEDGERTMTRAIAMFNTLYSTDLTVEQGWMFMALVKASRSRTGPFNPDNYTDGASYFALSGEAASIDR